MKTIKNILLLVTLLCLAGCKEDSQEVSFLEKEITVPSDMQTLILSIQANCSWTLSVDGVNIQVNHAYGEGNMDVTVRVFGNTSYDERRHTLTLRSEDNTSSDVLTIIQGAKTGLETGAVDIVSEEGGTFTVPVNTNDEITKVETPDWMTFVSSRGLTGYTYTFTAEPNKTGTVRKGYVRFIGKHITLTKEVTQDSYAPTEIDLSGLPEYLPFPFSWETMSCIPVSYPIKVYPEYADASKVSVNSSFPQFFQAVITGDSIRFSTTTSVGYGQFIGFTFLSDGKQIAYKKMEPIPAEVSFLSGRRTFAIGEEFTINVSTPGKYYTVTASDPDAITVLGPKLFRAEKKGDYKLIFTVKGAYAGTEVDVSIKDYIVQSYMSYSFDFGSLWDVELIGEFRGSDISEYTTAFFDGNESLRTPLNKISGTSSGTDYLLNKYSFSIIAKNREELEYKISRFKFVAAGVMNGKEFSVEIPVNPKR